MVSSSANLQVHREDERQYSKCSVNGSCYWQQWPGCWLSQDTSRVVAGIGAEMVGWNDDSGHQGDGHSDLCSGPLFGEQEGRVHPGWVFRKSRAARLPHCWKGWCVRALSLDVTRSQRQWDCMDAGPVLTVGSICPGRGGAVMSKTAPSFGTPQHYFGMSPFPEKWEWKGASRFQ